MKPLHHRAAPTCHRLFMNTFIILHDKSLSYQANKTPQDALLMGNYELFYGKSTLGFLLSRITSTTSSLIIFL